MKSLKLIFFSILFMGAYSVQAQDYFNFGPKAAFSVNSFQELQNEDQIRYESFSTVSAGAFGRVNLGKLYVQPEFYFLVKGTNFSLRDSITSTGKIRINTFEAPVLLGYHLVNSQALNIRAFAGPVFNLYTKETQNDLKIWDPARYAAEDKVHSLQLGVGADVMMLSLDARYEYGLSRFNDNMGARPRQFIISVGYKLF